MTSSCRDACRSGQQACAGLLAAHLQTPRTGATLAAVSPRNEAARPTTSTHTSAQAGITTGAAPLMALLLASLPSLLSLGVGCAPRCVPLLLHDAPAGVAPPSLLLPQGATKEGPCMVAACLLSGTLALPCCSRRCCWLLLSLEPGASQLVQLLAPRLHALVLSRMHCRARLAAAMWRVLRARFIAAALVLSLLLLLAPASSQAHGCTPLGAAGCGMRRRCGPRSSSARSPLLPLCLSNASPLTRWPASLLARSFTCGPGAGGEAETAASGSKCCCSNPTAPPNAECCSSAAPSHTLVRCSAAPCAVQR